MTDFLAQPHWAALMPQKQSAAPDVSIMKRAEATPNKETTMHYDYDELVAKANRLISSGDYDAAERAIRQVENFAKAKHRVTITHDDTPVDDWSEPANAKANGNNADGDDEDDEPDDYSSEADEPDEDDVPMKTKKGQQGNYNLMDRGHANMATPRSSAHKPAYTGTSTTSATTAPRRHKFESAVERLQRENGGLSKTGALQMARRLYPELFRDYNSSSAQVQQASRSGTNEYAKSRGASYEDLLGQELVACNGNEVLAKQRLIQRWGNSLPPSVITKNARDLAEVWQSELEDIVDETGASYCEAAQHLRKIRPSLFKAMRGD
jgi:hypothetical protein